MFEDKDVIRLSDNVFIHHSCSDVYYLYFNVGVQYFRVGMEHDNEEEARWTGNMLLKALSRFKEGMKGSYPIEVSPET